MLKGMPPAKEYVTKEHEIHPLASFAEVIAGHIVSQNGTLGTDKTRYEIAQAFEMAGFEPSFLHAVNVCIESQGSDFHLEAVNLSGRYLLVLSRAGSNAPLDSVVLARTPEPDSVPAPSSDIQNRQTQKMQRIQEQSWWDHNFRD